MGIGDHARQLAGDALQDGLRDFALLVLQEAKRNAPIGDPDLDPDPGLALAESGRVRPDGVGFVVEFTAPYAAKQHENLHLKHPRGGGAKYLERAVTTLAPSIEHIVASKVDARMASGLASDPQRPHR